MSIQTNVTGADILLKAMLNEGMGCIFGYPGGSIMPIYDVLYRVGKSVKHVLSRHEQGAVHAAEGYASASGTVGVCFATSDPGATRYVG